MVEGVHGGGCGWVCKLVMTRQVWLSVGAPYVFTSRNYLRELTANDLVRVMEHLADREQLLVYRFLHEDRMKAILEGRRQQRIRAQQQQQQQQEQQQQQQQQ